LSRLRIASGVSRQRLTDIRDGRKTPKRTTLRKVAAGLQRLRTSELDRTKGADALIALARAERDRVGLRKFARQLGFDHSTVAQTLAGVRPLTDSFIARLEARKTKP